MKTRQLTVRPFREDDLEALFQLLSDPEVMRYLEPPFSREQTADFLHSAGICDPPLIYAVEDAAGEFVGYVIYHPYGRDCYEIGWGARTGAVAQRVCAAADTSHDPGRERQDQPTGHRMPAGTDRDQPSGTEKRLYLSGPL